MARNRVGNIYWRKPDVAEFQVYVGTDPATGKPKYRRATFHGDKRAANIALAAFVAEALSDDELPPARGTVGRLLDEYIAQRESTGCSPDTIASYRSVAKRLKSKLGTTELSALTTAAINTYNREFSATGVRPNTVRNHFRLLSAALTWAVSEDRLRRNVALKCMPIKDDGVRRKAPQPEVVQRIILKAILSRNPDLGVAFRLIVAVGDRRGEACAIRRTDLVGNKLTIARQIVQPGSTGPLIERPTKEKKIHTVTLTPATLRVIEEHVARCEEVARLAGTTLVPDAFILCDQRQVADGSVPWRPNRLTQAWGRLRDSLGYDARLHDLRHFMASTLADGGEGAPAIAGRLGNLPETAARVYSHKLPTADDRAVSIIEAKIDSLFEDVA